MRRGLLASIAVVLTLLAIQPALPQATVRPCITTGTNSCPPVSASTPMPVSGTVTVTPAGTQNVNITQILSAAPSATNPIWVSPATASTPWAVSQATAASLNATIVGTGTLAVQSSAVAVATSGGVSTTSRIVSAANSNNATSAKGSSGRIYGIQGYNAASAVRYLKLYNGASAPTVGTDVPVKTLALPPSAAFAYDFANGYYFSTGIGYGLVTGSADNDNTAVTAGDILGLNIDYM